MALLIDEDLTLEQLDERVMRYEDREALSYEEFRTYIAFEIAYENRLLAAAESARHFFDHDTAQDCLEGVRKLNQRLVEIADRELARDDLVELYRADLCRWRNGGQGLLTYIDADELLAEAYSRRLNNDLDSALEFCWEARTAFAELAKSDFPQAGRGQLKAAICQYTITLWQGMGALSRAEYDAAGNFFRQALVDIEDILEEANAALADGTSDAVIEDIHGLLSNDHAAATALQEFAGFHRELLSGSYEKAIRHGTLMSRLHEEVLAKADHSNITEHVRALQRMDFELMSGWRDYAHAEDAIERKNWKDALDSLEKARQHWERGRQAGIKSRLPIGSAIQSQGGVFDLLLNAAGRRCRREQDHERVIQTLEQQLIDARAALVRPDMTFYGGVQSVSAGDQMHIGSIGTAGTVGQKFKSRTIEVNQTVAPPALDDLASLAKELQRLHTVLEQAATTPAQAESAGAVQEAAVAAQRDDKANLLDHLRRAGQWALTTAGTIGTGLAKAYLERALGLPSG